MATITNVTTGQAIAPRAAIADSYWIRFRGLMLRRRLEDGQGLDIRPCASIHMMSCSSPSTRCSMTATCA